MARLLAGRALVGRSGRACWACAAGGHAWGARAWRAGCMGAGALGGTGAGARDAGARGGAAAGGARVRGRAGGRQRRAGRAGRAQQGRGRCAAWVLGARPRRLGWPGLCTRCTRLDFQTGFRLGIFSESVNEHCSL